MRWYLNEDGTDMYPASAIAVIQEAPEINGISVVLLNGFEYEYPDTKKIEFLINRVEIQILE